jgi:hypothetical protein
MERVFNLDDQQVFAEISGDYNPIHIDPAYARRSTYGKPVVHGINLMLWALDCVLFLKKNINVGSLSVIFRKAITIGEKVKCHLKQANDSQLIIVLESSNSESVFIEITKHSVKKHEEFKIINSNPAKKNINSVNENKIIGEKGILELYLDYSNIKNIYPNLTASISKYDISVLLATTRLVGMVCPGQNSLYSELKLNNMPGNKTNSFIWNVKKYDNRIGLIDIAFSTASLTGNIKTLLRPKPHQQEKCVSLKSLVKPKEFFNQRALIIGGSRGLGEITAKLIALGAGSVRFTYHRGKIDAQNIVNDVSSFGGDIDCLEYNVIDNNNSIIDSLNNWSPTHLYYFATPTIISGVYGTFQKNKFNKYCDYYLFGFIKLIEMLIDYKIMHIFYPSSFYVDELPLNMGEYAMAKAAGEKYCEFLSKKEKNIIIYSPRLPRVSTDQTVSNFPVNNENPTTVMQKHLEIFNELK